MKLSAVGAAAIALFSVAVSAQTPAANPGAVVPPGKAPHIGGNSFEGPKDVVYLPTRPREDTLPEYVLRRLA